MQEIKKTQKTPTHKQPAEKRGEYKRQDTIQYKRQDTIQDKYNVRLFITKQTRSEQNSAVLLKRVLEEQRKIKPINF